MTISRRKFIQQISAASLLLAGGVVPLSAAETESLQKKSKLRFVIASDLHYGQEGTTFVENAQTFVRHVSEFHRHNRLDFCVVNGDVIHDAKEFLAPAKQQLDKLPVNYYVTKGNHDMVSESYWNEVWGMPTEHDVIHGEYSVLLASTSNENGEYLSPDLVWMEKKLNDYSAQQGVFIFVHIPQSKWTKFAIDTPEFFNLINQRKNVKAVFHGHEHEEDGVKMVKGIPYLFDSHMGGNWGTPYKGFRVMDVLKDGSLLTYIMNPVDKINLATF